MRPTRASPTPGLLLPLIEKLNTLLPTIDLPQEPLLAEAEMLEAQLQALMESAGGSPKPSPSSNAMLYG